MNVRRTRGPRYDRPASRLGLSLRRLASSGWTEQGGFKLRRLPAFLTRQPERRRGER